MITITMRQFYPKGFLGLGYTRKLENGKFVKYLISSSLLATAPDITNAAELLLMKTLEAEFHEPVNVKILDRKSTTSPITAYNLFEKVKIRHKSRKTLRSLRKIKTKQLVYQYNEGETLFTRYILDPINSFIWNINNWFNLKIKQIDTGVIRQIAPVLFFAIQTSKMNLPTATNELLNDLDKLQNAGLIMGSFCEPSIMPTANVYGTDHQLYTLFANPIVNIKKLNLKGWGALEKLDRTLGLKYRVNEGDVSFLEPFMAYHPDPPFDELIEDEIVVSISTSKQWTETQNQWKRIIRSLEKEAKKKSSKLNKDSKPNE